MKRMYLLCNAHIDPMWQWEWKEGVGAAISTFRVATELCRQYDAFVEQEKKREREERERRKREGTPERKHRKASF